jgi:hypothetical protein
VDLADDGSLGLLGLFSDKDDKEDFKSFSKSFMFVFFGEDASLPVIAKESLVSSGFKRFMRKKVSISSPWLDFTLSPG